MRRLAALLRLLFPRRAFRHAACRELSAVLPPGTVAAVWRQAQAAHAARTPVGVRVAPGLALLLRLFEWDCALYRALRSQGLDANEAGALIERVNWRLIGGPLGLAYAATRLGSRRRARRAGWLLDALFALLFTAPFRRQRLSPDGLEFDVLACPLADFFRRQGLPELTRHAACALDHRMARDWGLRLDRRETLAEGGARCDFRFRVQIEPAAATAQRQS